MGEHSLVGASSMGRWQYCTSSPSLILTLEPELQNRSSKFANEGSAAHRLCELGVDWIIDLLQQEAPDQTIWDALEFDLLGVVLAMREGTDDYDVVGSDPFNPNNDEVLLERSAALLGYGDDYFRCDAEMQAGVRLFLHRVCTIIEECEGVPLVQSESRVFPFPGRKDVFGTSDCIIIDPATGRIWVLDFKFGRVRVDSYNNPQALFYATGAIAQWAGEFPADSEVSIEIVQPRVEYLDGTSMSRTVYTIRDVLDWRNEVLEPAIIATQSPALAKYEQGEYCKYCPAAGVCPLMQGAALRKAQEAFAGDLEALPFEDVPEVELILPDPQDPDQLAAAKKIGSVLRVWADRVDEMVTHEGAKGTEIPGFKLIRGTTKRRWKFEDDVHAKLKENGKGEAGVKRTLLTPKQMEDTGALTAEEVAELAEKPTGPLKVVAESERGKAISLAAEVFKKEK